MAEPTKIKTDYPNINYNSFESSSTPAFNQGIARIKSEVSIPTEEISLENSPISNKEKVLEFDFSRIATSSDRAISGNFVSEDKIDKNFWDVKRLTYQKNEYGSYTIFRDDKPVGYTDEAGISGIKLKEEVDLNPNPKVNVEFDTPEVQSVSNKEPVQDTANVTNNYNYSDQDMELIYAIVMQEGGSDYDSALAVITSACNRAQNNWYNVTDPLEQLKFPKQYCYSIDSNWQKYLNNNVPQSVRDAVIDALKYGKRNHGFCSFRPHPVGDCTQIGGNYYF